ncbi:Eco57I restriction-modification methylase domain-containing protein [Prevotella falsenii]|uniref:Eco57I restriction-modification methylase domain-containing protein n=1 Tax=Prevotella falsenii TaxID=515414 RepID=UPI00046896EF|nr:Eco57I restriction-modification methylase domain-containing protein [Prevotella falsenii]
MIKKNKYGQYFTIESIAEFMVSLVKQNKEARVLEPSCGEGVFLKMLYKSGFKNIKGYEIDSTLKNPYDVVAFKSFIGSPLSERFNVVIGNPPYIRWKNLEDDLKAELAQSALWNKYFNSLCDYLFIFILKSIEQLEENGELVFICPEYWLNTTHSASLRNYMCANGVFSDIYLFKEVPLFEGVTSSFIIFRYIKTSEPASEIALHRYIGRGKPDLETLMDGGCFQTEQIPAFLIGERWILATRSKQELMKSFQNSCIQTKGLFPNDETFYRIGDFCDIGNGMVSGLDKAFKVTDIESLNENERNSLIKVNKAKDLEPYSNVGTSYYFFIKDDMEEKDFAVKFPHFYKQLIPYKDSLEKRYSYGRDLPIWQFAFPRNEKLFNRAVSRIFVPCKDRISTRHYFRFSYAEKQYYPLQDVTGILLKKQCKEDIKYILAYLNNERVFEWLKYNGVVKGEIIEFSEAPIASIPYRPIRWDNKREVALHDMIVKAATEYIKKKDEESFSIINSSFNKLFNEHN